MPVWRGQGSRRREAWQSRREVVMHSPGGFFTDVASSACSELPRRHCLSCTRSFRPCRSASPQKPCGQHCSPHRSTSRRASRNSPVPKCRRRLEPPPSLAQRFRHRYLIAGSPAGHHADGKMKRRLVVLPDGIEQDKRACDVARATQASLEPGKQRHIALRGARKSRKAATGTPPHGAAS